MLSSHRAICQALAALEFQSAFCAVSSPERIQAVIASGLAPTNLMAVPLFHVSGLHAQFLLGLRSGRRLLLMYKWDVDKAFDLIRDERCTQFNGAPVMMQQLLGSPRFASTDSDSLYGLGLGGAVASSRLLAHISKRKPHAIGGSGYGLTESNGIGCRSGRRSVRLQTRLGGLAAADRGCMHWAGPVFTATGGAQRFDLATFADLDERLLAAA